jgi:hypothetical protein
VSDEIFIDDDIVIGYDPEPTGPPAREYHQPAPDKPVNVPLMILLVVVSFFVGTKIDGCGGPGPRPDEDAIVIDEQGSYALILQDVSEAGQAKLTLGQKNAINSTDTLSTANDLGFDLRIIDKNDEIDLMEPVWSTLRSKATPPPSLTVASKGQLITGPLPDGVEGVRAALESIK